MMQSPAQSFSWLPLPLLLLLADDPMKTLSLDSQGMNLLEPAMIEQYACDRVELLTGNGPGVLWIDQATSVLRRFEVPADALRRQAEMQQYLNPSLVVEYRGAELNPTIPPEVFQFQVPEGIQATDALVMPILQVLGQPCPDFQFTDMEGNTTALSSLRDKVVVMQLWTSKVLACRSALQAGSKAYADLKAPDDVVMMAVCEEGENVQNASLQTVFKDWGVDLPIYRDLQQSVANHYGISTAPVTIVVGKKGNVQSLQAGSLENMDTLLAMLIERLQRGEDVYRSAFAQFENERAGFDAMVDQCVKDDVYCFRSVIPRTEVKPREEPAKLKMTKLWSCDQLKHPGNITVLPAASGPPRILVVDDSASVTELNTDGTVAANHDLGLQGKDVVTVLSTAVAGDGKRYFLGAAHGVEHVVLFDGGLKTLLVYPDSQHPGIGDAQLVDLTGDGKLEMVLAYAGVAGVHAGDLQGDRLWHNNSMVDAFRVAPLSPNSAGHRNILAMNGGVGGGTLVELDSQGKRVGEITLPNHSVGWVIADDLDGNGTSEISVLAVAIGPDGQPVPDTIDAMGIDAAGQVLWSHSLVRGVHREYIEPMVPGNVFPTGPKQWLIAAADGTITVIAADGQLVDSFAYGAELSGLATAQWDGKPVLLVSSPQAVEAWQIGAPAN
jgi:peroxiredoxin